MNGNVFIGWSGNFDLAEKVKDLLKKEGYNGITGGKSGDSTEHGMGATVISQMKSCCAAIMLFQAEPRVRCECGGQSKRKLLSANMLFELGFLIGSLRIQRVFTVYIDGCELTAPSDLLGMWDINVSSEGKTQDQLAKEIVDLFIFEQSEELVENKMELMTDISGLRGRIIAHVTSPVHYEGEIAQLMLLYCQSSYMFGVMAKAEDLFREILHSKRPDDDRVLLAINSSLCYYEICAKFERLDGDENKPMYLPERAYRSIRRRLCEYLEDAERLKDGAFKRLFLVVVYDYLTFANMMYFQLLGLNEEIEFRDRCVEKCAETCKALREYDVEKNDQVAALYESYGYRNAALYYKSTGREELAKEAFTKSKNARYKLLKYFRNKDMDKTLFEQIKMEYYLALTDDLQDVDETEYRKRIGELSDYVYEQKEAAFDRNFLETKIASTIAKEEENRIAAKPRADGYVTPFGFNASDIDAVKKSSKKTEDDDQ